MNLSDKLILIVDDVSENIQVALNVLKPMGTALSFAMSGEEALKIIENKKPSLILLDIMMPNMDGYEVCRILKSDILYSNIPIIFLTAKSSVDDIVKGFTYGGIDYITKPFESKELYIRVKTHLKNFLLQEQIKEQLKYLLQERDKIKILLSQQSKMASMGEMLSSISHQWKQPLSAIAISTVDTKVTEQLKDNPDETVLNNLNIIEKQIEFMVSTMNDFSNFFKPDKEKIKFSLMHSSYELINLFSKNFIGDSIIINLNSKSEHDIEVFGYESMYKQSLINIISNAADAIVENNSDDKNIFVECDSDNEYGIVTISNYAGQIPKENIDKIFDQFFTTKGEKGTGIGLSMTKQIIEDLEGGELSVKNIENGVVFTIKLELMKK